MAQRVTDVMGLINQTRPHRPRIDFYQPDYVWVLSLDELGYTLQYAFIAAQIASSRYRKVEGCASAGRVADVVQEKSHNLWGLRI